MPLIWVIAAVVCFNGASDCRTVPIAAFPSKDLCEQSRVFYTSAFCIKLEDGHMPDGVSKQKFELQGVLKPAFTRPF